MASRYSTIKPLTRCLSPLTVWHDGDKFVVPCGKCSACLLNRANDWSMRVGAEIENNPYSIFFTLTYNNHYVPILRQVRDSYGVWHYESSDYSFRWNGKEDVVRDDHIVIFLQSSDIPLMNYIDPTVIGYCSKRDIQLWLKLLKKDIYDNFGEYKTFRYFIISEYGPTTFRPHYHGILFPKSLEISEYLLRVSMFKNWKMSDKSLFDQYAHYCDSGCRGYVTQYLTCTSDLPKILKSKEIAPFRLSSKAPGIGFSGFDKTEISEKVYQSIIDYIKPIKRLEDECLLVYPKTYISRLFPRCYQYRLLSFDRLLSVYGKLYRYVFERGFKYEVVSSFLRSRLRPSDWSATLACFRFVTEFSKPYVLHPFSFVYLVDMAYYKYDMYQLRLFYEWQENHSNEPFKILGSYSNLLDFKRNFYVSSPYRKFVFNEFLSGFSLDPVSLCQYDDSFFTFKDSEFDFYVSEIEDITSQMVKMSKFNELTNNSPTTNF